MRNDNDLTGMFEVDENFGQRRSKKRTALDEVIFWFSVAAITLIVVIALGELTGITSHVLGTI